MDREIERGTLRYDAAMAILTFLCKGEARYIVINDNVFYGHADTNMLHETLKGMRHDQLIERGYDGCSITPHGYEVQQQHAPVVEITLPKSKD